MQKRFLFPLIILMLLSSACGIPGLATDQLSNETTSEESSPVVENSVLSQTAPSSAADGPFQVQVTSPIVVNLSWEDLTADKFLLEISVSGSEFGTLAELSGESHSYENFPALADRELQYRLTPINGGTSEKPLLATVQTPVQEPNPLTVTLVNDMTIPDPSTMDLSAIDPDNPDIASITAMFSPTLISGSAEIGPEGGEVSVTSSSGVKYTYRIPAGALEDTITFTIKPYTNIEGAPLSGALLGAVEIGPVGLELNEPAILTIEPAPGATAAPDELVATFAFMPDGTDFYFSDAITHADVMASLGTGKVGAPALQQDDDPEWVMKPWDIPQTTTGPAGIGVTNRTSVKNQAVNHPPSGKHNRTAQNDAAAEDDLAPIIPSEYLDYGKRSQGLSGWGDTLALMADMEFNYNNAKDKKLALERMDAAIGNLVDRIERNFKLNLNNCVSKDDFNAYYAAKSIKSPRMAFMKILSSRYQSKYGTTTADDVIKKAERCNLRLFVASTVTVKSTEVDLNLQIETEIPLKIHYDNNSGGVYYTGTAVIKVLDSGGMAGECKASYLTQGKSTFIVNNLKPVFAASSAALQDFDLSQYTTTGSSNKFKAQCPEITVVVPFPDGTSAWGGFYTVTKFEDYGIRDWQVSAQMAGRDLATKTTVTTKNLANGTISENSTFSLRVNAP